MANLTGNEYKIQIDKETTYGTDLADYVGADCIRVTTCEMLQVINSEDIPTKTNTNKPTICETKSTTSAGTVTITGKLNPEHEIFFEAMTQDSTSPYIARDTKTANSYQIFKTWSDNGVDVARGCVLETISITGTSGNYIEFTATFRAKSVTYDDTTVFTNLPNYASATVPACAYFNFGSTTIDDETYSDDMTAFTLNFNNVFGSDETAFTNAIVKQRETLISWNGDLSTSYIWDTTKTQPVIADYYSDSVTNITMNLVNASTTVSFDLNAQLMPDYTKPDTDKELIVANYNWRLAYDGSDEPLTITVTT